MSTRLSDYDFELPDSLIAQAPAEPRDASRLLVVDRAEGRISHHVFTDLPGLLSPGDLLVANNTRVLRARLLGHRILPDGNRGGQVQFLMLERVPELGPRAWEGLMKASARYLPGLEFEVPAPDGIPIRGRIIRGALPGAQATVVAEFDRDPALCGAGELPLPPYISADLRAAETSYQTVYAQREDQAGSAAAPTAGLHFTPRVFEALRARGIDWQEVTLDVGLGTFRPVKVEDIREHAMHAERYEISPASAARIQAARDQGRRLVAVGTTSVRTLESAARLGVKRGDGEVRAGSERTSIFLHPESAEFLAVGALLTNFHLPKSTLLMLVSAFAGRELIREAYATAVRDKYRFFSYGDAMLIL